MTSSQPAAQAPLRHIFLLLLLYYVFPGLSRGGKGEIAFSVYEKPAPSFLGAPGGVTDRLRPAREPRFYSPADRCSFPAGRFVSFWATHKRL